MKKMKDSSNMENKDEKPKFSPRTPDYSSSNVAVWTNENNGRKWLKIKIAGQNKNFVAFENKLKRGE